MIKWLLRVALLLILLLGIGGWFAVQRLDSLLAAAKPELEQLLTRQVGRPVFLGKVRATLVPAVSIHAEHVVIQGVAQVAAVHASFRLLPLLGRRLVVSNVTVEQPTVKITGARSTPQVSSFRPLDRYEQTGDARELFIPAVKVTSAAYGNFYIDIDAVTIRGGSVDYIDGSQRIGVRDLSFSSRISADTEEIRLQGVKAAGVVEGEPLSIAGDLTLHGLVTPVEGVAPRIVADSLTIEHAAAQVTLSGELQKDVVQVTVERFLLHPEQAAQVVFVRTLLEPWQPTGEISGQGVVAWRVGTDDLKVDCSATLRKFRVRVDAPQPYPLELSGPLRVAVTRDELKLTTAGVDVAVREATLGISGSVVAEISSMWESSSGQLQVQVKSLPLAAVVDITAATLQQHGIVVEKTGQVSGAVTLQISKGSPRVATARAAVKGASLAFRGVPITGLAGEVAGTGELSLTGVTAKVGKSQRPIVASGKVQRDFSRGILSFEAQELVLEELLPLISQVAPHLTSISGAVSPRVDIYLEPAGVIVDGNVAIQETALQLDGQPLVEQLRGTLRCARAGKKQSLAWKGATGLLQGESFSSDGSIAILPNGGLEVSAVRFAAAQGELSARGTFAGEATKVAIEGNGVSLEQLLRMAKISAVELSGTATISAVLTGAGDSLVLRGRTQVANAVLKNINLLRLSVDEVSGVPFIGARFAESIPSQWQKSLEAKDTTISRGTAVLELANNQLTIDGLELEYDLGAVFGEVQIAVSDTPAPMRGAGMLLFAPEISQGAVTKVKELATFVNRQQQLEIPVTIGGTVQEPKFTPDIKTLGVVGLGNALFDAFERRQQRREQRSRDH